MRSEWIDDIHTIVRTHRSRSLFPNRLPVDLTWYPGMRGSWGARFLFSAVLPPRLTSKNLEKMKKIFLSHSCSYFNVSAIVHSWTRVFTCCLYEMYDLL